MFFCFVLGVSADLDGNQQNLCFSPPCPSSDTTPPYVTAFVPEDNSANVPINSTLSIQFDEIVNCEGQNLTIYKSSNNSVFQSFVMSTSMGITGCNSNTIVVTPGQYFDYNTNYYVQISSTALKDVANNYFTGISDSTTWDFAVETGDDYTAPTVTNLCSIKKSKNL